MAQPLSFNNKRFLLQILLVLFVHFALTAQDKRDYQWFFGKDQMVGPEFRALKFDFNKRPFSPEIRDEGLRFDQNNVIHCNPEGELLFYSNGCAIANHDHEVMMNGDSINVGEFFYEAWFNGSCGFGYPGGQDMLILDDPADPDGYYVLHKRLDKINEVDYDILYLTYSYVDMNLDGGRGAVTEKNVDFERAELGFLWSYLTAVPKDNGEDWWIINPEREDQFYVFSLDQDGLSLFNKQAVGHVFSQRHSSASGDAKFSPDGESYAFFNRHDGLLFYDFDRTTGELSGLRTLPYTSPGRAAFATCEWSPNSRYLYLATSDSLWQVDTYDTDLENGRVFIAEHNGVTDPISTRFFVSTLGPDCRIYIRPGSSSRSFHVINKPNEHGLACDFVQQGIRLPELSSTGSFPNFPRFRVDEEEKCDPGIVSIFGEDIYWRRDLSVYPNPAVDRLTVELPEQKRGTLFVIDMAGQILASEDVLPGTLSQQLSLGQFPAGTYSVEFIPVDNKERRVWTSQVVVVGGG